MYGIKVVGVSMNRDRASNLSLPWESGAEDARTPNATAWSADLAASAERLECVRFIGAFRPAWHGQLFMVAMDGRKAEGALHEPYGRAGVPPRPACPVGEADGKLVSPLRASVLRAGETPALLWHGPMHAEKTKGGSP